MLVLLLILIVEGPNGDSFTILLVHSTSVLGRFYWHCLQAMFVVLPPAATSSRRLLCERTHKTGDEDLFLFHSQETGAWLLASNSTNTPVDRTPTIVCSSENKKGSHPFQN